MNGFTKKEAVKVANTVSRLYVKNGRSPTVDEVYIDINQKI
jgi:hypothetical protein